MTIEKEWLGCVSLALAALGYAIYIRSILQGRTRPHGFTWLIWGVIAAIVYVAQYQENAGPGAWAMGGSALASLAVALLSLRYGETHITRGDWTSLLLALGAIPLWLLTKDPLPAIILVTCIDACGYYPTARKSYLDPEKESVSIYVLGALQFLVSLLAVDVYSLTVVLSPAFIIIANLMLTVMILYRRHTIRVR